MGVLLRVITIVVVLSLTAAVAESASPTEFATRFLRITALAAPATLTTLMLWCAERRAVPPLDVRLQRAIAWVTPALVAYAASLLFGEAATPWTPVAHGLAAPRTGRWHPALL